MPILWDRSRGTFSLRMVYICVALFLGITLFDLFGLAHRRAVVSFFGLSYSGLFRNGWLHQFLTAPLLHGGPWHLLFNMLSLWMLGPAVERTLGQRRYIGFSALCAISSMIGFLIFNWGTSHIAIGYSGVIFGILVAQAVFFPNNTIFIYFFPLKMKHAALILAAVELYLTVSPEGSGIAHAAHLFGGLAAFVYLRGSNWWRRITSRMRRIF